MVAITTSPENRVLLQNISWQTFKTMLAETGSERNSRFAYDNGTLEIMTPQMPQAIQFAPALTISHQKFSVAPKPEKHG